MRLVGRSGLEGRWHLVKVGVAISSPAKPPSRPRPELHAACTRYTGIRQVTYGKPTCKHCLSKQEGWWGS